MFKKLSEIWYFLVFLGGYHGNESDEIFFLLLSPWHLSKLILLEETSKPGNHVSLPRDHLNSYLMVMPSLCLCSLFLNRGRSISTTKLSTEGE